MKSEDAFFVDLSIGIGEDYHVCWLTYCPVDGYKLRIHNGSVGEDNKDLSCETVNRNFIKILSEMCTIMLQSTPEEDF